MVLDNSIERELPSGFIERSSGLFVPESAALADINDRTSAVPIPAEPREVAGIDYAYDPENPKSNFVHYEQALDFANDFEPVHHKIRVTNAWKYLMKKASFPPYTIEQREGCMLYRENVGFRYDFVIATATQAAKCMNAYGLGSVRGMSGPATSFLVHLSNVELGANPPIPRITRQPVDVMQQRPKR